MASDWQKSLRRSTGERVQKIPFRNAVKSKIPSLDKGSKKYSIGGAEAWPVHPIYRKSSKSRQRRVLSIVIEDDDLENLGSTRGVVGADRKNSRKSSRPSLTDITNEVVDVPDHVCEDEDVFAVKEKVTAVRVKKINKLDVNAPKKKDQSFLLAIPSLSSTSSRTPSPKRTCKSPTPLPEGVICLDTDDGTEHSYANDAVAYLKGIEAENFNKCRWKGWKGDERRKYSRALLLDWIIEVIHYLKASQECLYQSVHIIDKFLGENTVHVNNIQLVGMAAVLIGTKLEEYFSADLETLQTLSKNSYKAKDIIAMEMEILGAIKFRTYSVDPMIFINRCIKAACREDDCMFYEASIFFLDSIICTEEYWGFRTSKKCAAAVFAAMNLIPLESDFAWSPTLVYYSGYTVDQITLMARQMIDLLWQSKVSDEGDEDCGLRNKYKSYSRHQCFFNSDQCSLEKIEDAIRRISGHS